MIRLQESFAGDDLDDALGLGAKGLKGLGGLGAAKGPLSQCDSKKGDKGESKDEQGNSSGGMCEGKGRQICVMDRGWFEKKKDKDVEKWLGFFD